MRKKDVVLMATVTSFESLPHPSRSELRQFAELFSPLFSASSEEARRQSVAALSQSEKVPAAVAFFIASQPISISAPFLISSPCLSNEALIAIARTQGLDHARAIARRDQLSPTVIDALVGMRYDASIRRKEPDAEPASEQTPAPAPASDFAPETAAATPSEPAAPSATAEMEDRLAREEQLRRRIKLLAGHPQRDPDDRLGLRQVSPIQSALLVRFARNRETGMFCGVLADALSASHWLAERIMLDISGHQLATTLKGLFMGETDAVFILEKLYNHLSERHDGRSRAAVIWHMLETEDSGRRLEAWRRADGYTYAQTRDLAQHAVPMQSPASAEPAQEELQRPFRTSASIRRSARGR